MAGKEFRAGIVLDIENTADIQREMNELAEKIRKTSSIGFDLDFTSVEEGNTKLLKATELMQKMQLEAKKTGRILPKGFKQTSLQIKEMNNLLVSSQKRLMKTSLAGQNVIRIVQDAPFGMMGITNNLQEMSMSLAHMTKQTGSFGAAMKATMASVFTGPMAFAMLAAVITSVALRWDDITQGIENFRLKLEGATSAQIEFNKSLREMGEVGNVAKEVLAGVTRESLEGLGGGKEVAKRLRDAAEKEKDFIEREVRLRQKGRKTDPLGNVVFADVSREENAKIIARLEGSLAAADHEFKKWDEIWNQARTMIADWQHDDNAAWLRFQMGAETEEDVRKREKHHSDYMKDLDKRNKALEKEVNAALGILDKLEDVDETEQIRRLDAKMDVWIHHNIQALTKAIPKLEESLGDMVARANIAGKNALTSMLLTGLGGDISERNVVKGEAEVARHKAVMGSLQADFDSILGAGEGFAERRADLNSKMEQEQSRHDANMAAISQRGAMILIQKEQAKFQALQAIASNMSSGLAGIFGENKTFLVASAMLDATSASIAIYASFIRSSLLPPPLRIAAATAASISVMGTMMAQIRGMKNITPTTGSDSPIKMGRGILATGAGSRRAQQLSDGRNAAGNVGAAIGQQTGQMGDMRIIYTDKIAADIVQTGERRLQHERRTI